VFFWLAMQRILAAVLAFVLASAAVGRPGRDEVVVLAAASLSDALTEIARDYQRSTGTTVRFSFAASSTLARQIGEGVGADLFCSADEAKLDGLQQRGLIVPGTRVPLLSNTLVMVTAANSSLTDIRAAERIAIAEPDSVPAGIYAKEYLRKQGLWVEIAPRLVYTDNVRGALAAVESGDADAAFVYRTDAMASRRVRVVFEAAGPRIVYPCAVLKDGSQQEAAKSFLGHLRTPRVGSVFARRGFIVLK
jgi:molybdate transport system substrate-binding protein